MKEATAGAMGILLPKITLAPIVCTQNQDTRQQQRAQTTWEAVKMASPSDKVERVNQQILMN
jgi:hypothetical protein